ncbi:MAG: aminotransferase class III-fold pyridoxal phosphate-dependent enzyme, partial [Gammaproteobacteria bacterium]|nr:aminotransferase class III-fold pyridoxal phosphate-dependent enzyme [Gammaproteobacteria bacterium]
FGPYGPGFNLIDFGDPDQLEAAITPNTVAFLVEPIQAEAGVRIPPPGYLSAVRRVCSEHEILLVLDEIQTGLGRTGKFLAHEHEPDSAPDVLIVGKALGGGVYPVSAVLAPTPVMSLFQSGEHGSTFGGNPLAAAVGKAALEVICDERLSERTAALGDYLLDRLRRMRSPRVAEIRGRGLLVGIELRPGTRSAREICDRLLEHGVLTKDTHERVVRLAPPLIIEKEEIDWLLAQLEEALTI